MRTAGTIFGVALAALMGGCAHETAQAPGVQAQAQGTVTSCPLAQLRGVHATVADIQDGVAITFTAPQSEVDALKQDIHAMADANDKMGDAFAFCPCAETGPAPGAAEAMPSEPGATPGERSIQGAPRAMPPASAKVEEISTGAILRLNAKDSSQIGALRSTVRQNMHTLRRACFAPQSEERGPGREREP
jgi:hypothetical protein